MCCVDVENCGATKGFGYIYIYIYRFQNLTKLNWSIYIYIYIYICKCGIAEYITYLWLELEALSYWFCSHCFSLLAVMEFLAIEVYIIRISWQRKLFRWDDHFIYFCMYIYLCWTNHVCFGYYNENKYFVILKTKYGDTYDCMNYTNDLPVNLPYYVKFFWVFSVLYKEKYVILYLIYRCFLPPNLKEAETRKSLHHYLTHLIFG